MSQQCVMVVGNSIGILPCINGVTGHPTFGTLFFTLGCHILGKASIMTKGKKPRRYGKWRSLHVRELHIFVLEKRKLSMIAFVRYLKAAMWKRN